MPSEAFEAQSASEFGGQIQLKISILGVGTLILNEQIQSPGGITVNALHLTLLGGLGDVTVSQAKCMVDP